MDQQDLSAVLDPKVRRERGVTLVSLDLLERRVIQVHRVRPEVRVLKDNRDPMDFPDWLEKTERLVRPELLVPWVQPVQ
jgi:hypothetical protein